MQHDGGPLGRLARALAGRGPATGWPWWLPPVLTGLLVFSTVWGFGRSAFPASADAFLVAAIVAALAVTVVLGAGRRP
jgi:hypothetical protein